MKRFVLITLGVLLLGMGYIGILLPGVPTTPFVLAASYCFVNSSSRLHRWLMRSPVFGPLLRDWHEHRGIRLPIKIFALVMVATVVTLSIVFSSLPDYAKVAIACLALIGMITILLVPTVRR